MNKSRQAVKDWQCYSEHSRRCSQQLTFPRSSASGRLRDSSTSPREREREREKGTDRGSYLIEEQTKVRAPAGANRLLRSAEAQLGWLHSWPWRKERTPIATHSKVRECSYHQLK